MELGGARPCATGLTMELGGVRARAPRGPDDGARRLRRWSS